MAKNIRRLRKKIAAEVQPSNSGFIINGYSDSNNGDVTNNHGGNDFWMVQVDLSGNIIWKQCYGGALNEYGLSVKPTTDGGFILGGSTTTYIHPGTAYDSIPDYWVVKTDPLGAVEWQKAYGGSGFDEIRYVQQTEDGDYLISGYTGSNDGDVTGFHGYYDFWILNLNPSGDLIWSKCFGGSGIDRPFGSLISNDGQIVIAGDTKSNDGDVTNLHGDLDF